jgi:excisionase family DNA binding protein
MTPSRKLISLAEAAEQLGVHYMTAYRYVRTGRMEAVKAGHEWQVAEAEVERLKAESTRAKASPAGTDEAAAPRRASRRPAYADRLVERLLHDDEAGAFALIESAMTGGMDVADVYLQLLRPALDTIGARWARDEITVADEHRASAIVLRLIGRLGPRFSRRGRKRGTILLGAPPGERHGIPTAMLRDLLRGQGFDVIDLGPDVPVDSWTATVAATPRLRAVGLCATTEGNDGNVRAAIDAVRAATTAAVVLGGGGIVDEAHALGLGATCFSGSFPDAVQVFDALPG